MSGRFLSNVDVPKKNKRTFTKKCIFIVLLAFHMTLVVARSQLQSIDNRG